MDSVPACISQSHTHTLCPVELLAREGMDVSWCAEVQNKCQVKASFILCGIFLDNRWLTNQNLFFSIFAKDLLFTWVSQELLSFLHFWPHVVLLPAPPLMVCSILYFRFLLPPSGQCLIVKIFPVRGCTLAKSPKTRFCRNHIAHLVYTFIHVSSVAGILNQDSGTSGCL